jgi:uncharacterized protein (TIGR02453 family)
MPKTFPGFSTKALSFFRSLERNNKREWFTPRKAFFEEQVRGPMLQLVGLLNDDLRGFSADHVVEPKKAIFRIYRDTRFSKDKSPYKTHIAASFPPGGMPRHCGAGFYFYVSHKGAGVAGGMYMPGKEDLAAVRKAIAENYPAWKKLVEAKELTKKVGPLLGEKLSRVPKGFAADHPAAEYLRMKQWYFDGRLPADVATKPALRKEVAKLFRAMTPVVQFLNSAAKSAIHEEEGEVSAIPKRPTPMF